MNEEEKRAMLIMSQSEINPTQVTLQVLQLCNVVRERLGVNGKNDFMKKRSGLGGTGGRLLSPELRMRFGTYGFYKKKDEPILCSLEEQRINSTIPYGVMSVFEGSTHALSAEEQQHRHHWQLGNNFGSGTQETLETVSESLHRPPATRHSINLGMSADDDTPALRSVSQGSQKPKKRVVLRKPYQGGVITQVKSQHSIPTHHHTMQESSMAPSSIKQ